MKNISYHFYSAFTYKKIQKYEVWYDDDNREVLFDVKKEFNSSIESFISNNVVLLLQYQKIKHKIPFDSMWFVENAEYRQWHNASHSELNRAVLSPTALSEIKVKDLCWIEKEIFNICSISCGCFSDKIFAIGIKILVLILSAVGISSMWQAVFADTGLTLLTILNTTRILKK